MTLNPQSPYPRQRNYVLKLRRASQPGTENISGRLENMNSGRQFEFGSAEELLACLAADLASMTTKE